MKNYRRLVEKAKEVDGFIKTFAETCRPDNKDISILDTRGKELNKIANKLSEEEISEIERNNSKKLGEKKSIFYRDIECDVEVFDFDVIENANGLLSMDAFMIDDEEETYLMIECKERSIAVMNKYGEYITKQNEEIKIKSMTTIQKSVKVMFDKYKGTLEKIKKLECDISEYFSNIILFIDIRVAEELSLVEKDSIRRIVRVEVNKYIERYKKDGFSFQVIYDEKEIINRVKKMDKKQFKS